MIDTKPTTDARAPASPLSRSIVATSPTTAIVSPPSPLSEFPIGKDRSPAAILGLSIITLGIYCLVWHYKMNNEIHRHDPDIKVSPGLAVLAMCFPITNLVSGYGTAARIRQMQLDDGLTQTISPVVALLLIILLGIGYPLYVGSAIREHWHLHRRNERTHRANGVTKLHDNPLGADQTR